MTDRYQALEALRRLSIDPYPARCRRTHLIADLSRGVAACVTGGEPPTRAQSPNGKLSPNLAVAGRLVAIDAEGLELQDPSGRRRFARRTGETAIDALWPFLAPGDLVQLELEPAPDGSLELAAVVLLSKALRAPVVTGGGARPGGGADLETLARRAQVLQGIRQYFHSAGFLEVETPILAVRAGLEPHLDPFESRYRPTPASAGTPVYLLTSPEYAMKRLVAAGQEKVFQLSRVFRNGEVGQNHNPEFTMLEWYRAFASYLEIQEDLEGLVLALHRALGGGTTLRWQGRTVDLTPPWPRLSVREAFLRYTGIDLAQARDAAALVAAARAAGIPLPEGERWEDGYFRILIEHIEPRLGLERPVFLTDYPAQFAALAKVREEDFPVAERFELYIAGVEVGNAYSELNDPVAQRRRFDEERAERAALGFPVLEPDEAYLEALEQGLPPTGGIAVGVDRLVMLLLDLPDVRHTLAFPFPLHL